MILLLTACAPDIRDLDGDGILDVALPDTGGDTGEDETGEDSVIDTAFDPHVTVTDEGGGVSLVELDSNEGITYVDLGVPEQTNQLEGWELGFERYFFYLNGGVNGTGGVEALVITDQSFDAITSAPADGWATDTEDVYVLEDWYIYDSTNHVLTAADQVYLVRNPAGEVWKVQFIDYYDDYGNTGFPSFRVAAIGTE